MDPTTLLILLLVVLAGGGAGGTALLKRYRDRRRLRRAVMQARSHGDRDLSVFDVFWDLGASDYALELMRHDGLLLTDGRHSELEAVHAQLDTLLEWHGGYEQYLDDSLEAIEEFYEARLRRQRRRYVPKMDTRERKLLVADGGGGQEGLESRALADAGSGVPQTTDQRGGRSERLGTLAERSASDRERSRSERVAPELPPRRRGATKVNQLIDVDSVEEIGAKDVLSGMVEGNLLDTIQSWWEERQLRSLKADLDGAFESLYDYYVERVDRDPEFYDRIYGAADRWDDEASRIEGLADAAVLEDYAEQQCADILLEVAAGRARDIARRTRANISETIERIHDHARQGDYAMAGYLVYLNRYALFAGGGGQYGRYVRRVENLAYKMSEEMRRLES